ncbi:MAG TPA: hypothetical protein HA263_03030 [Methanoregulaceae archaeon]|nr:hypothetical protein [Methanoregulaceae archaeon]
MNHEDRAEAATPLIGRHIGERVRVRLMPFGSIVGVVLGADETALVILVGDGTTATIPIGAIQSVRPKAAWAAGGS